MDENVLEDELSLEDVENLADIVADLHDQGSGADVSGLEVSSEEQGSHSQFGETLPSGEQNSLLDELEKLRVRNEQLLRVAADFENYKRRTDREKEDLIKFAGSKVLTNMLPVIDNFERALIKEPQPEEFPSFIEGIHMIRKQLMGVLEKAGVSTLNSVGEPFNPEFHEAVMTEASDEHPDGTVLEEFQTGYIMNGRLLRPAMVKVSSQP